MLPNPLDQILLDKIRTMEALVRQKQQESQQTLSNLQRNNRQLKSQFQLVQRQHQDSKKQQTIAQNNFDNYRLQHDTHQGDINEINIQYQQIMSQKSVLEAEIIQLKQELRDSEQLEVQVVKSSEQIRRLKLNITDLERQVKVINSRSHTHTQCTCCCTDEITVPVYVPIVENPPQVTYIREYGIHCDNILKATIIIMLYSSMLQYVLYTNVLYLTMLCSTMLVIVPTLMLLLILMIQNTSPIQSSSSAESLSYSSSSSSSSSRSRSRNKRKEQRKPKRRLNNEQSRNLLIKQYQTLDKMKHKYLEKIGYTDQDNPYGDKNLAKSLVWKQKLDMRGLENLTDVQIKSKLDEMATEIEKLKDQRNKKQQEKIKLEEEKNRLTKERQAESYQQWIDNETIFFEKVEKLRPLIRIQQQREVPFDKFVRICCIYKAQIGHQKSLESIMQNPSQFIKQQSTEDQRMILNESKKQLAIEMDNQTVFQDYWTSLISISSADVEWREQQEKDPNNLKFGIQVEFKKDIKEMFSGKTREELEEMEVQINFTLNNGAEFRLDFDYWEKILKKLKVIKAKTILKTYYDVFCKELKYKSLRQTDKLVLEDDLNTKDVQINVERRLRQQQFQSEETQPQECVSPLPVDYDEYVLENEDLRQLEDQRIHILMNLLQKAKIELENAIKQQQLVIQQNKKKEKPRPKILDFVIPNNRKLEDVVEGLEIVAQQMFEYERSKPLEEDEVYFNEVLPSPQDAAVAGKIKMKRPQYFNRVKMGFDWNMYNKTHYDIDNPPPKVVQGYKFNIFYPELVDKNKAPKYTLEPCENSDYCTIRFIAGRPYEDLAFRILCREWDYSDRMGFKSVFSRGILHLYFNFKKPRYRR